MKWFILLIAVALCAAGVAAILWQFERAGDALCGNEAVSDHVSPDGVLKVIVFRRSCGATTPFITQASLLPAGERLSEGAGNLFAADADHGAAPQTPGGGPRLDVYWTSPKVVTLAHDRKARVFLAETAKSGVTIRYADLPAAAN